MNTDHATSMPTSPDATPSTPQPGSVRQPHHRQPVDDVTAAKLSLMDLVEPDRSGGGNPQNSSQDLLGKASDFVRDHKGVAIGVAMVGGVAAAKFKFFRRIGAFFIASTARKLITEGIKRST